MKSIIGILVAILLMGCATARASERCQTGAGFVAAGGQTTATGLLLGWASAAPSGLGLLIGGVAHGVRIIASKACEPRAEVAAVQLEPDDFEW